MTELRVSRQFMGDIFEQGNRVLLCLLLLAILIGIGTGAFMTLKDALHCMHEVSQAGGVKDGFKRILIDALTTLAMVEVFHTALVYLREGRVRVTFIIDTVLVALLTEVIGFWHIDFHLERMLLLIGLVVTLMVVRILAIRFSPQRRKIAEGL